MLHFIVEQNQLKPSFQYCLLNKQAPHLFCHLVWCFAVEFSPTLPLIFWNCFRCNLCFYSFCACFSCAFKSRPVVFNN